MRLATLRDGTRDGALVVVDGRSRSFVRVREVAANLQGALDDWACAEPALRRVAEQLNRGELAGEPLEGQPLAAPLPRAYEWIDGSAYLNHVRLVRRARGAAPPDDLERDPLVYQGGAGVLLGPNDPLVWREGGGLDFEGEVAVVLDDVAQGTTAGDAARRIRLLMLANDVTYRDMVPAELKKGFGFFVSKPATAFSPFAVTPDELGDDFHDARAWLRLVCTYNDAIVGELETGREMHFSFAELISHAATTRRLVAGTILGGGTISNADEARGVACLAERRSRETIALGAPRTAYMAPGDVIRIEAFDRRGRSVCGALEQRVVRPEG